MSRPPGDRFPSSIPTPDEARQAAADRADELIDFWDLSVEGNELPMDDPQESAVVVPPVIDEILEAAAPKMYEAWAESRVEPVAISLARHNDDPHFEVLDESSKATYRRHARAALGLGERT